jgi:hypothetical protein
LSRYCLANRVNPLSPATPITEPQNFARRAHYARHRLSVLRGPTGVAFRRNHLLPCDHGGSDLTSNEANNMHALAHALWHAGILAHLERNPAEAERLASEVIELSTRQNSAPLLRRAAVLRGWARSASGDPAEGISRIEDGIEDHRATGAIRAVPYLLALTSQGASPLISPFWLHQRCRLEATRKGSFHAECLTLRSAVRRRPPEFRPNFASRVKTLYNRSFDGKGNKARLSISFPAESEAARLSCLG